MSITNKDLPAFPAEVAYDGKDKLRGVQTSNYSGWEVGLTKREYIAAKVLQGMLTTWASSGREHDAMLTKRAVELTDALFSELEK